MAGACTTCQLTERRDHPETPEWDRIIRTDHWDLAHAFDTSHVGWLVLVARVHRDAISDLTDDEANELGVLVRDVSIALRDVTGCPKTYVAQFAEHPDHQHVHVHVVARTDDLDENHRGPFVFAELGAPPDRRIGDAQMNELAKRLRDHPHISRHHSSSSGGPSR